MRYVRNIHNAIPSVMGASATIVSTITSTNSDMKYALKLPTSLSQAQPLFMRVHPDGDQHVSAEIRDQGTWEAYESELMCRILSPGDCVIDVGANIGYYSVLAAAAIGDEGRVFAFEPEPANFALLENNIALNSIKTATAINAGLAAKNTASTLFLSETNWGDHQIYSRGERRKSIPIELLRGDDFFRGKIDRFDLIKIDTQGAEFQVLSGLEATLRASLPNVHIIIEFWPFGLKKAGDHGHQLLDLLASLNLPFWTIDHIGRTLHPCQESELRDWVDALDANPSDEGFFNLLLSSQEFKL